MVAKRSARLLTKAVNNRHSNTKTAMADSVNRHRTKMQCLACYIQLLKILKQFLADITARYIQRGTMQKNKMK